MTDENSTKKKAPEAKPLTVASAKKALEGMGYDPAKGTRHLGANRLKAKEALNLLHLKGETYSPKKNQRGKPWPFQPSSKPSVTDH